MNDNKLITRQQKFNNNLNPNFQQDTLLKRREEVNLTLRKDKIFKNLMDRRLNDLNRVKKIKKTNSKFLEFNPSELNIPNILKINLDNSHDKLIIISKLIIDNSNIEELSNEDYRNFGIYKMRKYLQDKNDKISQTEKELIMNLVFPILNNIFFSDFNYNNNNNNILTQLKLKYEISWIFINLTSEINECVDKLLQVTFLKRLEEMIDECINIKNKFNIDSYSLIKHIFWIFGNLLSENREANVIVRNSIDLLSKFNLFLNFNLTKNFKEDQELKSLLDIILWTVQSFMRETTKNAKHLYQEILINIINLLKIATDDNPDFLIYSDCLLCLKLFCDGDGLIETFLENQIVPLLLNGLSLNQSSNPEEIYQNIKSITNIFVELLCGDVNQVNLILSYPLLNKFKEILNIINDRTTTMKVENNEIYYLDSCLVKDIFMGFSNICASTQENIEKIIFDQNLMNLIFSLYEKFEKNIKIEVMYIFSNSFQVGNNHVKSEIVRLNILKLFMENLNEVADSKNDCPNIIVMLLTAMENFLNYGEKMSNKINFIKSEIENENILTIIDKLQFSIDPNVYDLAGHIFRTYWGEDEILYEDYSDLLKY